MSIRLVELHASPMHGERDRLQNGWRGTRQPLADLKNTPRQQPNGVLDGFLFIGRVDKCDNLHLDAEANVGEATMKVGTLVPASEGCTI